MVCVQPVKFDVQVIRVDTFLRRQLHSIRQRIVPILYESLQLLSRIHLWTMLGPHVLQIACEAVLEMVPEFTKRVFIGSRLKPSNSGVFVLLLNQPQAQCAGEGIEQHHPDVDPFVADQIRGVPQDVINKFAFIG